MRARFVNEAAGTKDIARIESLISKSKGDSDKELQFAMTMAKSIKNPGKAQARGEAAEDVFGGPNPVADVFFDRASELSGGGTTVAAPSKLPGEKEDYSQYEPTASQKLKGFNRRGSLFTKLNIGIERNDPQTKREPKHHGGYGRSRHGIRNGMSIASLGSVNLKTGNSPIFNVYDTWEGDDTTVEVWQTRSGKYKLMFTSGSIGSHKLGDTGNFKADQSMRPLFRDEELTLVDYTYMKDAPALIPLYGKSLPGYTYK